MNLIIAHGDDVVPGGIEPDGVVKVTLAEGRANRPHAAEDLRVIGYQVVGTDADDRAYEGVVSLMKPEDMFEAPLCVLW